MELIPALEITFDHTRTVLEGVRPDQLDAPTPCREWDVRALATHTTWVVANLGRGAAGEELIDPATFSLGDDPAGEFGEIAAHTLAAWTANGLTGDVNIGVGERPAEVAAQINLLDTATHTWDLARATGQDGELPPDVARAALAAARAIVTEDLRGVRGFDPVQPTGPDTTPTEELAAFLGRKV